MKKFMLSRCFLFLTLTLVLFVVFMVLPKAVTAEPINVVDQRGKTIKLTAPAGRIVVIPIPMTSVIMALDGSSERLIGIHPTAHRSIKDGFLKRIFPEALNIQADVVRGGRFNPNLESILSLKPDLVIQWIQPAELITTLEDAGIKTVGLINNPPTQEINERNLTILATVIGRLDRLDKLLKIHHETMRDVVRQAEKIPGGKKPRAIYFRSAVDTLRPSGSDTYNDFWINLTGGYNVAATKFKGNRGAVNAEQLIKWNPEVVFLGAFDKSTPEDFMSRPELQGLSAVRNKRVYKIPHGGYRWDPGSHESFLSWQWVAMIMHPEYYSFDLRTAMKEFYRFIYNYELVDDEVDKILQMNLNAGMAGYERFRR